MNLNYIVKNVFKQSRYFLNLLLIITRLLVQSYGNNDKSRCTEQPCPTVTMKRAQRQPLLQK